MKKALVKLAVGASMVTLAIVGFELASPASAAPAEKVTICHRAPDETHYVIISTRALTPYGAVGHFDAGGDPEPGHEGDVFPDENGDCPCLGEENTKGGQR